VLDECTPTSDEKERSLRFEQAWRQCFAWTRLPASILAAILNNILAETHDETLSQQSSNKTAAVFAAYVQSLEHRLMAVAGAVEHDIMPQWNSRLPTPWRNKICDLTVMGQRIACRISDVLI
jgi:hypothetical protein